MNKRDLTKIQKALKEGWVPKEIKSSLPADAPTTELDAILHEDGRLAINYKYYENGDADNPVSQHTHLYEADEIKDLLKEI